MAAKDELGRRGEDLAVRYLQQQGLVILSRNWRCRHGELDVIGTEADVLVVCEVKTRSSARFGEPSEAVDHRKVGRIRRTAGEWLSRHQVRTWVAVRFDVISVVAEPGRPVTFQHVRAAF